MSGCNEVYSLDGGIALGALGNGSPLANSSSWGVAAKRMCLPQSSLREAARSLLLGTPVCSGGGAPYSHACVGSSMTTSI